jgi:hypothetical protein
MGLFLSTCCDLSLLSTAYYGITGFGIPLPFIKPFLTSGQITQFMVILAHSSYHLYNWDKFWAWENAMVQFLLMWQMLYMFSDFFVKMYLGKKGSTKAATQKTAMETKASSSPKAGT